MLLFYITHKITLHIFLHLLQSIVSGPYIISKPSQHFVAISHVLHIIITDCKKLKIWRWVGGKIFIPSCVVNCPMLE
jgi:hypothetical protein